MVRHTGEDFIDVEGVAITSVSTFQSTGINGTELDAPEADWFSADSDASFGQKIFDITVAEIEAIVEPDSIGNDIGRESVTFICIHPPIVSIPTVNLAIPFCYMQSLNKPDIII